MDEPRLSERIDSCWIDCDFHLNALYVVSLITIHKFNLTFNTLYPSSRVVEMRAPDLRQSCSLPDTVYSQFFQISPVAEKHDKVVATIAVGPSANHPLFNPCRCTINNRINGKTKGVYLPISKLHLAVSNLIALDNLWLCY